LSLKKIALTAVSAMAFSSLAAPAFSQPHETDKEKNLLKQGYEEICAESYPPAIETLTRAVKLNKDDDAARRYLVYAELQVGQVTDAFENLKILAASKNPQAMDHYLEGEAHLLIGWIDSAESDFNTALSLQPDMKAATVGLIKVRVCNSDFDDAVKLCSECMTETKALKPPNKKLSEYFDRLYGAVKMVESGSQSNGLPGMDGETALPPPEHVQLGT
jgi:Flp pilus assembly protein TadD